jgi:hypothetical protein
MGKSVNVEWMSALSSKTSYYVHGKDNHGKIYMIFIPLSRVESLHSIIHEINECEILELLRRLGIKKFEINVTKTMVEKYPDIFRRPMHNVSISHLLSPFGMTNTFLPRKSNRALW